MSGIQDRPQSSHSDVRVVLQMGGGAVTADAYAVRTGANKLCWSVASDAVGSRAYDSRESIAVGGIMLRREVMDEVDNGVE